MITLGQWSEDYFSGPPAGIPTFWEVWGMSIHVLTGAALCFAFMYLVARLGTDWRAWLARSGVAIILTIIMVEATGETRLVGRVHGFDWARLVLGYAALAYFAVAALEFCLRLLIGRIKNG